MSDKSRAAVWASFCADALALAAHWEYDTERLARDFGRLSEPQDPPPGSYHQGRKAGDFTHYGDQSLVLLEHLAANPRFDLDDFAVRWRRLFDGYQGYVDKATRQTLENFAAGAPPQEAGSQVGELGGAARIAPLLWALGDDLYELLEAVRLQTRLTHDHPHTLAAAEFLARAGHYCLGGEEPLRALELAAEAHYDAPVGQWVELGLSLRGEDTVKAVARTGQTCAAQEGLPAVVHLIARYPHDLQVALVENVMAGGDSAARGMAAGMILGAARGMSYVPGRWIARLTRRGFIEDLLACRE